MIFTTCRLLPDYDTANSYGGKEIQIKLTNNSELELAKTVGEIYETVLWYFQFNEQSAGSVSHYFGVMDIDLARGSLSDDDFLLKIKSYLPLLLDKLHMMNYHSYRIYFSGNKGYHVYLFDPLLWRIPRSHDEYGINWIEQQVELLYPELCNEVDYSIYHCNKGIRNFLIPNPKSGKVCSMVCEKNAPPCLWSWLIDIVNTQTPAEYPLDRNRPSTRKAVPFNKLSRPSRVEYSDGQKPGSLLDKALSLCGASCWKSVKNNLYIPDIRYCPIKGGHHKNQGKTYVLEYDGYCTIRCHSVNCAHGDIIIREDTTPLTDFYHLQEYLKTKKRIEGITKRVRIIKPDKQKHVLPEDIGWALQEGLGIISAPMGSGKTTSTIQWITQTRTERAERRTQNGKEPKPFRVLLLVTRITQAINFKSKYPGMVSYLDKEGSVSQNETSVLCINSLQRAMQQDTYAMPRFHLLILDEIESLIEAVIGTMLSKGKNRQCNIWQLFKCLIFGSKRVLFMDGILTERTARFLDKLKVLEMCNLVQHEGRPDLRKYINYRSDKKFGEQFDADCSSGKKVVIVSNSKQLLYSFAQRGSQYAVSNLVITGDSTDGEKQTAADPDEEWTKELLCFNTAVGAGASYDKIHYDVMYVLCSPVSCTPYSLYQMINRIRTLKEQEVKMYIIYNESTTVPTREELKIAKSTNIIKMHNKQNEFQYPLDFYEKRDNAYFKLDMNTTTYDVVRKLIKEQNLVLHHEDTHFIDTLIDYEYKKLKFNHTPYYAKVLFDIIKKNGGRLKGFTDYKNVSTDEKKLLSVSSRRLKKDGRDNYKVLALSSDNILTRKIPDDVGMEFKTQLNRYVQLNDIETQIRWCAFRRAITKSEPSVYEKELDTINTYNRAISNTLIFSTGLLESFKEVCERCGFKIDTARGIVDGSGNYSMFSGEHQRFERLFKNISDRLYDSTKRQLKLRVLPPSRMRKDTATFKNLTTIFNEFGLTIILSDPKGTKPMDKQTKERYCLKTFEMCIYSQYVRMALNGLAFDTGLPIENAFGHLKSNYTKSKPN